MAFGFGFGLPRVATVPLDAAIAALFADGSPGAWYDPSDLTTLYQDSAGTTPVTAVEQPVGLMLDKSKGLVLGSELVTNGDFSNGTTGWTLGAGWTISDGTPTKVSTAVSSGVSQSIGIIAGKTYLVSFRAVCNSASIVLFFGNTLSATISTTNDYVFRLVAGSGNTTINFLGQAAFTGTIDNISVRELPGNHAIHTPGSTLARPVLSRRVNGFVGTETLATQSLTTLADEYTLSFTGTGSITLSGTATGTYAAGTHTVTCTAGTLTATVTGSVTKAWIVPSDLASLGYQRVNTTTDYDSDASKFPTFLRCDGVDDAMQTNSINFTGTDKMTVVAGVRKIGTRGTVVELSSDANTNNGAFRLGLGSSMDSDAFGYTYWSRGTNTQFANSPANYPVPGTAVLSGVSDISGDSAILRVNGAQVANSTSDQGTGNYGNYPLYLFRRGGTTLPFNGFHFGNLIIGRTLNASELALVERYMAQKTKTVTLA